MNIRLLDELQKIKKIATSVILLLQKLDLSFHLLFLEGPTR
ncbi:MAG: hypothetical protein HLUCCX10_05975 [Algoriphagus marincola HL-49]|uniref:Uncharacterized protein n=1 Tax=Algoriphagus marincola HL-49 TaxID=1305737 RepID=A0A0N8KGT9_9BACT|nr:MAG: hypothetical protein HLUCCX10_05975 [Algoriphagus marincola HL-49]